MFALCSAEAGHATIPAAAQAVQDDATARGVWVTWIVATDAAHPGQVTARVQGRRAACRARSSDAADNSATQASRNAAPPGEIPTKRRGTVRTFSRLYHAVVIKPRGFSAVLASVIDGWIAAPTAANTDQVRVITTIEP